MCAMSLSSQQQLGSALLKPLLCYSLDEVSHGDGAQSPLSRVEGIPQIGCFSLPNPVCGAISLLSFADFLVNREGKS